jgi:hypothetical protein
MELKIIITARSGKRVILFPEREHLRWYVTEISPKNFKPVKHMEKKISWECVIKALGVDTRRYEESDWWAKTTDLSIEE